MDYNDSLSENMTNVLQRYSWPIGILKEFCPAALYIDRYVTPIWYVIGLFTNPISAYLWLNRRNGGNNSSVIYLAALSLTDFMFLWLHFISELQTAWGIKTFFYYGICQIYNIIYMIPQYTTPLIVLAFTVERWIAVCKPFDKERYCTVRRAVYIVLGLILFSTALASAQMYIWTFDEVHHICNYRMEDPAAMKFMVIWNWVSELTIFGVIPICVLIFNILVIIEIRKITKADAIQIPHQGSSSGNNPASTITLLSVSFYLIFTTLPVTFVFVINHYLPAGDMHHSDEEIRADQQWSSFFMFLIIRRLIEELCFSHYSCYFFVYCVTGPHFRKAFMALFPVKVCQTLIHPNQDRASSVTGNGRITNKSRTTYVLHGAVRQLG